MEILGEYMFVTRIPRGDLCVYANTQGSLGSTSMSKEALAKADAEAKLAAEIAAREAEEMAFNGTWVMMNGLPGKMGVDVAAACLRKGFRVAPYALTGPDVEAKQVSVDDQSDVRYCTGVHHPNRSR